MNKIYKVVWSKAKHAYVVTSEVARSHTKSASGKAVKAALAAAWHMARAVTRRKQKMWPLVKMQLFPIQVVSGCHPQGIL